MKKPPRDHPLLPGFDPKKGKRRPQLTAPTMPVPVAPLHADTSFTDDRLHGIVKRIQNDPEFVKAQRRWLHARQNETMRLYLAARRASDPGFKLMMNLRGRIHAALKGAGKSRSTMKLIGCSISELKAHLEKQFTTGMSWSNYGEWHVDHIVPCRCFDLTRPDDQQRCFNFSNLQPLWADDNFKKSAKYPNA